VNNATNLTYVMPGSELKLVTSEGIVQFVDASQINDSVLVQQQISYLRDSIISKLNGIDMSSNLEIAPDAKFTVQIDPKSGDYLTVSGSAKLDIDIDRSGKQSVNGTYEVKSGNYQVSFYGLVKKSFSIEPGSTVTWSGRPMDADLNITATYVVRTSSATLVANETSSLSDAREESF